MKKYFRIPKQLIALLLTLVLLLSAAPVAFAQSFSAYVSATDMPVYSSKAMTKTLGYLPVYTVVKVLDFNGDLGAPVKISYNGNTGYALPRYMQSISEDAQKATVNADTKVLLKYKDPTSGVSVKKGTEVTVVMVKDGTALIERSGVGAFVDIKYLGMKGLSPDEFTGKVTPAPTPDTGNAIPATVVVASTGVHAGKTNKTKYLGSIKKGTQVNVIETGATWAYIELNGKYGYCDIRALKKTAELPTPTPVVTPKPDLSKAIPGTAVANVKVYQSADTSSKYLGTLKAGKTVNVIDSNDNWAYIELNGNYGYCDIRALKKTTELATPTPEPTATPAPDTNKAIPATVVAASASVHAGKTNKTKYLGTIKKGTQVNVIEYGSTWAYIELNGKYGYCDIRALKKTAELPTPTPVVTPKPDLSKAIPGMAVANVKVYQSADTSSKYLGTLKAGKTVNVIDSNDHWAYIELSGNYGYCAVSALIPLLSMEEAVKAVVSAAKLDFYAAPSAAAKHLGRLSKGAQLNVLTVMDGWVYVEYKGNYGWCKVDGLTAVEAATPTPTVDPLAGWTKEKFEATVVTGSAIVQQGPGTGETKNVSLGTNVTVEAYNTKTGWAAVVIGNIKGYMQISDLSRSEFATLTNGSSGSAVSTLEKALLSMGYFDENPDSNYNSATAEAVKLFQSACGMSASGNADAATQRVLFSGNAPSSSLLGSTLAKGSSGASVTRIQRRLFALGYLRKTSSVDGDYGSNTYNAIGLFQQNNGLDASGTADSATLKKLYSTGAAALPSDKRAGDEINIVNPTTGTQTNNSTSISSTLKSTTSEMPSGANALEKIEYMIYVAQNQLGKPYVYGATGTSKYDCSGFTQYCFKQVGVTLPRTAQSQGYSAAYSRIENVSDLKRGDLVFFNTVSDSDSCDHAGIYLGAGWFIHASSGQAKVVISNLASNYYNRVFSWAHRPLG